MAEPLCECEDKRLATRWKALQQILQQMPVWTLAYSGGLDSRFLAHAGRLAGSTPLLVHLRGPHVPSADSARALDRAAARGMDLRVLDVDPLTLPLVAAGDPQRCYACKRMLFEHVCAVASGPVCDGSNVSDAGEYRPGRRALQELGIRSPLEEAGLHKDDIRSLARLTGMADPDQPAKACLLTRLPYGECPTRDMLALLDRGEDVVEACLQRAGLGKTAFRLRKVGHGCFALHLALQQKDTALCHELKMLLQEQGFTCLDVQCMDAVSGYFDRKSALHK